MATSSYPENLLQNLSVAPMLILGRPAKASLLPWPPPLPILTNQSIQKTTTPTINTSSSCPISASIALVVPEDRRATHSLCATRRRLRYEEDNENEDGDEEYGHNSKIAMLESYSESMRNEALLVRATVDGEEEVVLIFKGFSSLLSSRTVSDPSRSVLPARAVIESIDVVKGPFNPSNIEYLEKGLTWEAFKSRLQRPS